MRISARPVAPPRTDEAETSGTTAAENLASILGLLRQARPRVHCLTNAVAQEFTANVLLAAGAVPSMTIAPDEIACFVARSDALLINLGTFDAERRAALPLALDAAAKARIPIVLDPVFVEASPPRLALAREILRHGPGAIRLNAAEFTALAGVEPDPRRIRNFAGRTGAVVALTGKTDVVCDAERSVAIHNGHDLMTRVTAMGCAAGAVIAACLATGKDPLRSAAAGLAAFGIAGEIAAEAAKGPGSFAVELLDALAGLDMAGFTARARIQAEPSQAEVTP